MKPWSTARWPSPGSAVLACMIGLSCLGTGAAHAQDAQALRVRSLAATCASCHGTSGQAVDAAAVPGLAGMPAAYLVEQMNAFKSGARTATVMHQISKGFSDLQVDQLAAYFAAQKK